MRENERDETNAFATDGMNNNKKKSPNRREVLTGSVGEETLQIDLWNDKHYFHPPPSPRLLQTLSKVIKALLHPTTETQTAGMKKEKTFIK